MKFFVKIIMINLLIIFSCIHLIGQQQFVNITKVDKESKVNVFVGGKLFTSFLYPDSIEKPVLFPVFTANQLVVTRGFPLNTQPNDPNDHPHHIGIWMNFEQVNGIDFWNNSYAISQDKKVDYGRIKTTKLSELTNGLKGKLTYLANWVNVADKILLNEKTIFTFSGTLHQRIIDRQTILTADTAILFTDAKDGLLGMRLVHALQIPTLKDQEFKDAKGNTTIVKGGSDTIANGNYLSSENLQGDSVWSTRGRWCKAFGKVQNDSVSVVIIDHPGNFNYPTFWHARGYGLFAANPLGEKIFTNGKSYKNLSLAKGASIIFRYRIIIDDGKNSLSATAINKLADDFANTK